MCPEIFEADLDTVFLSRKTGQSDVVNKAKKADNISDAPAIIGTQLSSVAARLDATHSLLQNALNSILETRANQSEDYDTQGPNREDGLLLLDDKINNIMARLEDDGARMSRLEQKFDILMGQLQSMFSASEPRSTYGGYDQ